jgi:fructose-bisphosphate aldolase class II
MALVNVRDMLEHAYRNRYAVGAFDLVSLDFLEAIVAAAERLQAPVILSLAESHFEYYGFESALAAAVAAARRARVPVAIHLDHSTSLESAVRGINLGCNGVMVDASACAFEENVARTRAVTDMARGCGVAVEGGLGYVAGVAGEDAAEHPGAVINTAPEEAAEYVQQTGVDFLAVSIGSVHGRMHGTPRLDLDRLAAINERLGIPLAIHGGSGLGAAQFRALVARGVAKINDDTALADAAAASVRAAVDADPRAGYTALMQGVRAAIAAEVERRIRLGGAAGRAAEVFAAARPWREVEHLIVYNVAAAARDRVAEIMREGRAVLARIPGVRRVFTGDAVTPDATYRHCWLVRFSGEPVIAGYREHPLHKAFADQRFRPLADERISIDYIAVEDGPDNISTEGIPCRTNV